MKKPMVLGVRCEELAQAVFAREAKSPRCQALDPPPTQGRWRTEECDEECEKRGL